MTNIVETSIRIDDLNYLILSNIEKFDDNSGYCANLKLASKGFGVIKHKLYFDHYDKFIHDLGKCHSSLCGSTELRQRYEHEHVRFEYNKLGHVIISGHLEYQSNSLNFELEIDQTYIGDFLEQSIAVINGFRLTSR